MKSYLGYGGKDYFYYKMRCGNAVTTLREIDYDVDANEMTESNEDEREIRLVLSKDQVTDRNVAIDEDLEDLSIDAYKDWLSYLHERDLGMGELCF
jgi:hypothetical protein